MGLEKSETACSPAATDLVAANVASAIKLPKDVADALEKNWGDLPQYAFEIVAVEDYRSGVLTQEQLHRMLSLKRILVPADVNIHRDPSNIGEHADP